MQERENKRLVKWDQMNYQKAVMKVACREGGHVDVAGRGMNIFINF